MKEYIIALTTCPESKSQELAHMLVEKKLCACVNIIPSIRSIYEWKDEIMIDIESMLIIKTHAEYADVLEKVLIKHHPYEIPEFIIMPIESGSSDYLKWISSSISKQES